MVVTITNAFSTCMVGMGLVGEHGILYKSPIDHRIMDKEYIRTW